MSTPDQPGTGKLTRRQMRELRLTGATPVIDPETPSDAVPEPESSEEPDAPEDSDVPEKPEVPAPLTSDDGAVDANARPLTRRQAREQERLRTDSVPVVAPSYEFALDSDVAADSGTIDVEAIDLDTSDLKVARAEESTADEANAGDTASDEATADDTASDDSAESRPTVGAAFGVGVLDAEEHAKFAPSFDELITRPADSGGSVSTPNALILPQLPGHGALGGPVSSTGEVIVTSAHALDGFGSQGHAKGAADGKDLDSVLVDGEIPLASSPTPIAASSAVSTSKSPGEVIRPPAAEKSGRLMFTLAITAGVLAVALIGVLVVAWVSGAFS